jgi:hypothetical protein
MRSGIPYPDERLLIVRPCHVALCIDVRPAAKLLSALLYRYSIRQESKEDAENINELRKAEGKETDQDTSFRIYRKQSQLVRDMVNEITEKTLHDVAVPSLQLLGYMDIEEYPGMNCYILHIDRILRGIAAYTQDLKDNTHCQLEKFLMEAPALEKFLMSVKSLEKFLVHKKNFQSALEKVLMDNRKSSNYHRGRKPRSEAPSKGKIETPESNRENLEKVSKKEEATDSLTHSSLQSSSVQEKYLSTPIVDKPVSDVDNPPETQLPIATVTTGNASSTPNVRNTEPLLSPDGQRVRDYWSQLGFESTSASNTHWNTLSKHIASLEQMDSLYEYARTKLKNADDPTVHPGNMVKAVNGWKQKQAPDLVAVGAQQPKPKTKKQAEEEWIASLKADPWK